MDFQFFPQNTAKPTCFVILVNRELKGDMVAAVKENEPGTMVYEWFISGDNTKCNKLYSIR